MSLRLFSGFGRDSSGRYAEKGETVDIITFKFMAKLHDSPLEHARFVLMNLQIPPKYPNSKWQLERPSRKPSMLCEMIVLNN
jgi:hypothetical protein